MATQNEDQLAQYTIFIDGDPEVLKFIKKLGFTTDPVEWRSKKLEKDKFEEIYTCLQKDYHGGLVLFAAQIYHECVIQTSGKHIFLRGDRDKVKRARSFLEGDQGRDFGSSYRHLLDTNSTQVKTKLTMH